MSRTDNRTIAQYFDLWLAKLNEANRRGLVDSCHELGRIAEGLRQLAEALSERDPDWDCTIDGKWNQQMFDMTWADTMAWSTEGKVDELLCIESTYSELRRAKARKRKRATA